MRMRAARRGPALISSPTNRNREHADYDLMAEIMRRNIELLLRHDADARNDGRRRDR